MEELRAGMTAEARAAVTAGNTAAALGNEGVHVFATPFLVALVEEACRHAVEPHLPSGSLTLGGHVDLRHLAPTPEGWTVTARATLVEVAGPRLVFDVEARDGADVVARARHTRFVAGRQGFLAKVAAKAGARPGRGPAQP